MSKTWKFLFSTGKILVPALTLFAFSQCTDERELLPEADPASEVTAVAAEQEDAILSLTVDGIFTEFVSILDCKTCNYIVPQNASVVDGKKLGIKPGQAICLDSKFSYGNLELINLEGSEENPILIAYNIAFAEKPENKNTFK
jgi:hypothetical protein